MLSIHKSINYSKSLIVLGLAALGLFILPNSAKALTLVERTGFTDTDFENLLRDGQFSELFVTEGRIGNNSLDTTERELGINAAISPNANGELTGGNPITSGEYVWGNNQSTNFTLEYTGSAINYTVGGQTLTSTALSGPVTDIFVRTFASNNGNVALTNLTFDNEAFGSLSSSSINSSQDTDYIQLSNISTPFTLTGQASIGWTGTTPARSQVAYQIKVGNSSSTRSVPEPGTVGAILLVTVAGIGYGRFVKRATIEIIKENN
ncbi:MAG: choice-of-anchor W domain-containing protein [Microcystaceae cyanobacterium]